MSKAEITRDDLLPRETYSTERKHHSKRIAELKAARRVAVGPDATFYFESWDTMWFQIQEMLHIEKGGEEQIPDELAAYNPLIPNGKELVATMMLEIPDPTRRQKVLASLGGIEESLSFYVNGEKIIGVAEEDVDRTNAQGKASSVQFIHFSFTDSQIASFSAFEADVSISIEHPNYRHMAGLSAATVAALSKDFN